MPSKPVPHKIQVLLDNPQLCSKVGVCYDALKEVGMAVMMEIPLFCKEHGLDASAVVLALNRFLTTLEVIRDRDTANKRKAEEEKAHRR